jgi:hypothetical protein
VLAATTGTHPSAAVSRFDTLSGINIHLESPLVINSTAVKLSWIVSSARGYRHFDGFHIMYRRVRIEFSGDSGDIVRLPETDYSILTVWSPLEISYVLAGLQQSSSYEIFIQTFHGLLLGATSNVIHVSMTDKADG